MLLGVKRISLIKVDVVKFLVLNLIVKEVQNEFNYTRAKK
jgi:hypothetical protein